MATGFVLATMSITQFMGCSAIGFIVGAVSDSHKPDRDTLTYKEAISLEKWDKAFITLKKDSTYETEILGIFIDHQDSMRSVFVVRDLNRDHVIQASFGSLQMVALPHHEYKKWYGLGIGLVVDAAAVSVAAILIGNSMNNMGLGKY